MSIISNMDVKSYIVGLWEQMSASGALDRERPSTALRFDLTMSVSHNGYLKDGSTYVEAYDNRAITKISVIVTARHRVYIAASAEKDQHDFEPDDFVNTSNHDSCWKSDGLNLLTKIYFDMCKFVVRNWPEGTAPAPIELTTRIQLGNWRGYNPIQFVNVAFGPNRKDNEYFNSLSSIEKLRFKISF